MTTCTWKEDDGVWNTECGHAFELIEGTPSDNRMLFCPYCGSVLTYDNLGGTLSIGDYTIWHTDRTHIWIENALHEGLETDTSKLEAVIAAFFDKEF